ncbi:MAG: hypothetical protein AAF236_13100 [Verrucomicrobiota bacterium]
MKLQICLSIAAAVIFNSNVEAVPEERLVIGAEARKGIAIIDPAEPGSDEDHRVLWKSPVGPVHDIHLLPLARLLTQDGWTSILEHRLDGTNTLIYDASTQNRAPDDGKIEIHAIQPLNSDRGIKLSRRVTSITGQLTSEFDFGAIMLAESGAGRIIEIDRAGNLLFEMPLQVSKPNAHSDTRRVRKLASGNYLVAHEADQRVKEYRPDGTVIWDYPIPLFGKKPKKGHGPDGFGGRCFAAIKRANGNYLIATGNGHSVLEVTPAKEIVWKLEQNDLPGITLAWVTTIEERPNGNLMIGNCHAGPDNPQIIEITRDKDVVWTFRDFETFGNALSSTLVLDGDQAIALLANLQGHLSR